MAKSKTERCMKKLNRCDVTMLKLAVAAFVLFLITAWPALHDLLIKVHWGWYLAIWLIAAYKPLMKYIKA